MSLLTPAIATAARLAALARYILARAREPGTHKALVGGATTAAIAWAGGAPEWAVALAALSPALNVVAPDNAPVLAALLGRWGVPPGQASGSG